VILGHAARGRIRTSGADGGLTLAGIIVGWISAALGLIFIGLIVAMVLLPSTVTSD
jgi:hypothetical protein